MSFHIHWYEGLFLQPHHLQLMQRGLREQFQSERRLGWHYPYGVVDVEISRDELQRGLIVFNSLRLVMRSGLEVRVPDNAVLPSVDIDAELARSGGSLTIYLGVARYFQHRANAFKPGQEVDPRVKLLYRIEDREIPDENSGDNPRPIQYRMLNARLLLEAEANTILSLPPDRSDMEVLPILRIKRDTNLPGDLPRPDAEFAPPCLVLRGSPVLYRMVGDLVAKLEATRRELELQMSRGGMGLEMKLEQTQKLRTLNRFCGSLPSLVLAPAVTPFELYLELRELLGELVALHPGKKISDRPLFDCAPYNHDRPYGCFEELSERIRSLIIVDRAEALKVTFQIVDGWPVVQLNDEHFAKPNGWFLGVKTKVERTSLVLYVKDGSRFKLMPKSRLRSAVFGAELREENYPPQELPAQADMHYFRIAADDNSPRWQEIKQEKAAVLVWNTSEFDLSEASFALYMTLPT